MFERLNTFWQVLCYQTIDAFSVIPLCSELVPITTKLDGLVASWESLVPDTVFWVCRSRR